MQLNMRAPLAVQSSAWLVRPKPLAIPTAIHTIQRKEAGNEEPILFAGGLLKKDMHDPIGGGIITYMLGGKQYVAVAGGMKNSIVQTESGPAWVAIFALPE